MPEHRYRAPEILVGSHKYSYQADVWSLGCIFGEMINGKPTFSGTSTLNQLEEIAKLLGPPTAEDVESFESEFGKTMVETLFLSDEVKAKLEATTLEARFQEHFPTASPDAIDLLMSLLRYNPLQRQLPQDGMRHAYCAQFHEEGQDDQRAEHKVGSTPQDAMPTFLSSNPEPDEKMMKLITHVNDNTKKSTQEYRDLLHGIANAHGDRTSSHR